MNYFKMKRRIKELEGKKNTVDYPDTEFNKKIWNFSYLNGLYERSVNGARSERSLKHLNKVCDAVHGIIALISLVTAICVVIALFAGKK